MSSTPKERSQLDLEEYVRTAIDDAQSRMWTSAPGIIKSYNREKQTVSVQLSVKSVQRQEDGSRKLVSIPVLQDVPVQFPGSGGAAITFPVKEGDECLVNFSCRSPDSWQQNGGEQAPVDSGMHTLSGGFAMLGFRSNPEAKKIAGGADPDAVQIRSLDGKSSMSLKPGGDVVVKNDTSESTIKSNEIIHKVGSTVVRLRPNRIDLGEMVATARVMTDSGPSSVVFAKT